MFLTSRSAGALVKYFAKPYSPEWSSFEFSSSVVSVRRHRYVLEAANICLDSGDGKIKGCVSRLRLSAVVFYGRNGPRLEHLDDVSAESDSLSIDVRPRAAGTAAKPPPAWLFMTPVHSALVSLSSFTFTSSSTSLSGSFRAVLTPDGPRPLSLTTNSLYNGRRLTASLTADTDLLKGSGVPTFVDVLARADLGPRGRARAELHVRRSSDRWTLQGSSELSPPDGPLRTFRLTHCSGSSSGSAGDVACRWHVAAAKRPSPPFGEFTAASGRLSLSASRGDDSYEASFKAVLDPIISSGTITGGLAVRASGRRDRPLSDAAVSHDLRLAAKLPRFEDLVAFLRDTKFAVPAPIHVLKGPLSLTVESRGDSRSKRLALDYALASDLSGTRQRLILRAKGNVAVLDAAAPGRAFEHAGELLLKEVALELPRLDVERAPKVFADKRIKTGREKPPAPARKGEAPWAAGLALPLRGSVSIKTEKPLVLFSNLAKEPVPLVLDLTVSFPPSAVSGLISVRTFDVELFRRNATVDHLNVALAPGSKVGALEGLVRYKTPSATVNILVLGTTEKPRIEFTSAPPMKRADIIGLLIFGKSPDELDPDQTASVTNTETALESQAFGLASLYLFGATPIEHVGYDPATKTTMVRLRLPGGANLTLGGDFYQGRQLSVRKPLAPHWAIQSEITDQGNDSRAAATFLEWFNRY